MHKLKLDRTPVERIIHVTHTIYMLTIDIIFEGMVYLPGPVQKTDNLGDH
jgi:hypothetical protein